ncbi:MAG TPA: PfkB family carbohydrate kinase [Pyrinomonadaceae bacterium]|nr:PfkB family carbohydrate kinase [Pyrinomonadaceae bacterium]
MKEQRTRTIEHADSEDLLESLLHSFTGRRVVVLGDAVADQFLYGEISRVSREAPVLILRHERTDTLPGGAANCAVNLAALGARAALVGVVGDDEAGRALLDHLRLAGVDCGGVITSNATRTTTKVRVLAGQAHSTRQQVIRIDYDSAPTIDATLQEQIAARLREFAERVDAIIVSDYNYGVAGAPSIKFLRGVASERGVPVIIDSRFRLLDFSGFTSATPNEDEVEHVLGARLESAADLEMAGAQLCARLGHRALLVTRGKNGMALFERGKPALYIEPIGAREAVDVTGAGDTVIATYTLALASGGSFADAAHLANHAGALVVMKRGTASVSLEELSASVRAGV